MSVKWFQSSPALRGGCNAGIYAPPDMTHRLKPTAVDLFSGIGGFSLEFIQAGFEIACAVDCPS
ncbi:MAG: DNA cytosine methyltransferase [Truepera sp.]|nr:DNA cytosine methyltransferase [Truepera sp.]